MALQLNHKPADLPDLHNQIDFYEEDHDALEPKEDIASSALCRICYENEFEGNNLVHPCKCTGSVKFIHEECLKVWLVSRQLDIDKAECELCNTPFKMIFGVVSECNISKGCRESKAICVFVPLLCVVLAMMSGILYVLVIYYLTEASSSEEQGYAAALIFVCVSSTFVLGGLVLHSVKASFIFNKLKTWQILDLEVEDIASPDEDSKEISYANSPLMSSTSGRVLVIPPWIKVGKLTVFTPELCPSMAILPSVSGGTVYAPPLIARSLNISPVRSRLTSLKPEVRRMKSLESTMTASKVLHSFAAETTTKRSVY